MKRLVSVVLAALVMTAAMPAAPAFGVGPCIGPITKSAVYTYADRFANIQFGDPVRTSKFKLTATFCYDGLGHAWGVGTIKWARVSGSAFINLDHPPYFVTIAGLAYAAISYGYFAVWSSPGWMMRIAPRLSISGVNGRFNAYDNGAVLVTEGFIPNHDYDPVFVSAALQ